MTVDYATDSGSRSSLQLAYPAASNVGSLDTTDHWKQAMENDGRPVNHVLPVTLGLSPPLITLCVWRNRVEKELTNARVTVWGLGCLQKQECMYQMKLHLHKQVFETGEVENKEEASKQLLPA